MLKKSFLEKIKEELEKKKNLIEQQLKGFAKKDNKLKGDWDSRFPSLGSETGGSSLEKEADEVQEYSTRLPIEFSLEIRLRDIDLALEKIKKGNYGICENCKKPIPEKRLKVCPEARLCLDCPQDTN
ncbi:TraR/DksA family transcriptional regulator [Patescibacteria group bacterium]